MIIIIAKIFAGFLGLIVIARSLTDYQAKKESLQMTVFWVVMWMAIITVAVFPIIIEKAVALQGGSRAGIGTIFGMAIIFVLFISYRVYVKAHRIEKQVNKIVRSIALEDINKNTRK